MKWLGLLGEFLNDCKRAVVIFVCSGLIIVLGSYTIIMHLIGCIPFLKVICRNILSWPTRKALGYILGWFIKAIGIELWLSFKGKLAESKAQAGIKS